jgi:hypothetical protein
VTHSTLLPRSSPERSEKYKDANIGELVNVSEFKTSTCLCGPSSVVDIATGYGLDGPGIECLWGVRFSVPVQTGPGAQLASCTMGTGSFPGVKSGWGVTLTPQPLLVPWS